MRIPVQVRRIGVIGVLVAMTFATHAMAAPQSSPASRDNRTANVSANSTPPAQTEAIANASGANLPVRRVVLYKSGVGFFEHQGEIQGNQTVGIDFTSGQLNDVLQSLTLLDLNGGRITGVNYNSQAPLSQRLGTLNLPLEEKTDVAQFYGALRGVRLEIKTASGIIAGRLLSVERKTRVSGGTTLEVDLATVVSDAGEVRTVEITPAVSVQVAERDVSQKVSQYLSLLASVRQQELRRLTVATAGTGDRQLYVSYISEVPVWKTTYRIVLPAKAGDEPLLQGWAIVDNTIGEDWNNVELSLVAGAPQSFIQQLSQPYYVRRPVVALPGIAQVSPQTHEGAMLGGSAGLSGVVQDGAGGAIAGARVTLTSASGESAGSTTTDNLGRYSFGDLPASNYALRVESPGFETALIQGLSMGGGREATQNVAMRPGAMTQTVTVTAEAPNVDTSEAEVGAVRGANVGSGAELGGVAGTLGRPANGRFSARTLGGGALGLPLANSGELSQARQQMTSAAEGTDLGDLFQYKLKDRVTIHKNESALVPILQAHVQAEKVSLWNASEGSPRPLRALWLTNSNALTLDGGSFSVLEDETFAGEGLTDSIKPGEKRLVSYAVDLGVRVDKKAESTPQRVTHIRITRGEMVQTNEIRQKTVYTIRNDDTTSREVLIEHPLRPGWMIAESGPQPEETTSNVGRFRVSINPKATQTLELNESQPTETRFALTNLTNDQITVFLQQKSITPAVEAALRKIVQQKTQVDALDDEVSKRDEQKGRIFDDQQRLRENLKALKGTQEERALTQRYTQQLADQETRLETLNRESADFQAKSDQAQKDLDDMIQNLDLDATI
jgi:hypothetical protein